MSESIGSFSSGQPIRIVTQKDRTPKRVFVLGVYASAVHARWIGQDGKTRIAALAVASEPEIFWTGEGSEQLIATITPPNAIGTLKSAGQNLNGPSGRALDEHILEIKSPAWAPIRHTGPPFTRPGRPPRIRIFRTSRPISRSPSPNPFFRA